MQISTDPAAKSKLEKSITLALGNYLIDSKIMFHSDKDKDYYAIGKNITVERIIKNSYYAYKGWVNKLEITGEQAEALYSVLSKKYSEQERAKPAKATNAFLKELEKISKGK